MKQNSGLRDVPVSAALSPLSPQAQASQPEQCGSSRGRLRNREALHAEIFYGKLVVSVAVVENVGIHHQIKSGSLVKQIAVIVFGNCPAIGFVADVSRRTGNRRPNLEKRISLSSQTVPQAEILRLARPVGFEKAACIKGNPQRFISGYGVGGNLTAVNPPPAPLAEIRLVAPSAVTEASVPVSLFLLPEYHPASREPRTD